MKKTGAEIIFLSIFLFSCSGKSGNDNKFENTGRKTAAGIAAEKSSVNKTVNVNELAGNPSGYPGRIGVRGAVSVVIPGRSVLIIIDLKEYDACKTVTCSTKQIPVGYSGITPPAAGEKSSLTAGWRRTMVNLCSFFRIWKK